MDLLEEESRRREQYIQPLLDGLKVSKNHYIAVVAAAENAVANSKLATSASIDFALAVCDTNYLRTSAMAPMLPTFQEAHHELSKISAAFIDSIQTTVLDVAIAGSKQVDATRKLKEGYYEKRLDYDMGLRKLQAAAKKLQEESDKGNPEKTQKAEDALIAAQGGFASAEQAYREAERKMAKAITEVVVAKSGHDVDFLAVLVEAQAARASASQAVLARLQPELELVEIPPPFQVPETEPGVARHNTPPSRCAVTAITNLASPLPDY